MDFSLDAKTDEDFFGALKRENTNLEHLFEYETQRGVGSEKQESLKYQPTKQAVSDNAVKSVAGGAVTTVQAWQTLLARVAQAYKEGVCIGKVGVALLQSVKNEYRIIIYKAKLNVLTTCSLRTEMAQIHRQNNYLQFYDDDLRCWSIYFDVEANTEEFVAKLAELKIEVSEGEKNERYDVISETEITQNKNLEFHANKQIDAKGAEKPVVAATKPSKTSLITRMAKMGQQLPKLSAAPHLESSADATDSSDAEIVSTPIESTLLKHQSTTRNSNRMLAKTQPLPVSQINHYANSTVSSAFDSPFMQMMLSENRTHSSELRMNINRLESKVEKVIDKIDLLHSSSSDKTNKEDEILALEEKVLELKKENRRLRQASKGKNDNVETTSCEQILQMYSEELENVNLANTDSLERLVGDLLQQRAALHEKLEELKKDLTEKNAQLKTHQSHIDDEQDMLAKTIVKAEQFEEEVKVLRKHLKDKEKIEIDLRQELAESNKANIAQKQQEKLEGEVKSLQQRLVEKEKMESDLRHQLAETNKECIEQRQKYEESRQKEALANALVRDLQEQNIKLQRKLDEHHRFGEDTDMPHEESLPVEQQIEAVLKKTMNNLYASLSTKLENVVPMQKNAVIAIVGKTIREETLKTMDELKQ
ncbi:uncharacterized protein LOC129238891 [Anastrepha obliqua]|uniref:uncharacterized protein LOC129238891 n=1 Tax=Anastrepha obliqua TaxID=95512 RepID=UPI00240A1C5C|nr:uncharacterized protein LOC129238891 [Anastrepha obliqua]